MPEVSGSSLGTQLEHPELTGSRRRIRSSSQVHWGSEPRPQTAGPPHTDPAWKTLPSAKHSLP